MTVFNFKDQEAIGDQGEALFLQNHPEWVKEGAGVWHISDFRNSKTNQILELKTESRRLRETPNIFVEVFSKMETEVPGGPFRNFDHDFIVYLFLKDRVAFWYNPAELCIKMRELGYGRQDIRSIKNKTFTTGGIPVRRQLLKPILIKEESYG